MYYIAHLEPVPVSGRTRFMACNREEEEQMGRMAYNSIIEEYRHRILPGYHPVLYIISSFLFSSCTQYSRMVQRVADNLIRVSGMQDLNWEV